MTGNPGDNYRVLCVDDQQEVLDLIERHLGDRCRLTAVTNPDRALHLVANEDPFAVVIADYAMPAMNGIEFLAQVKDAAPDSVRMMLTAFDDLDIAVSALHEGNIFRFLRKPWVRDDLVRAVDDARGQYALVHANRVLTSRLQAVNQQLDKKVRELDELNRLLEYWVEFSPVVLYSAECDGVPPRLTYVSRNFVNITGHERTEMIVDPGFWPDRIHPDDRPAVATRLESLLADAGPTEAQLTYRVRHRDGTYRAILDAVRVVRGGEGNALEIVGAWLAAPDTDP